MKKWSHLPDHQKDAQKKEMKNREYSAVFWFHSIVCLFIRNEVNCLMLLQEGWRPPSGRRSKGDRPRRGVHTNVSYNHYSPFIFVLFCYHVLSFRWSS